MKGKINLHSIRLKMLVAMLLPVCLMIVLGIVAYEKAYDSITQTFTESVEQSVSMTSEYINFGLGKVKESASSYLVNDKINQYFGNKMGSAETTSYQTDLQNDFVSEIETDSFIDGIYILGDDVYSITSSQKSDLGLYSQFVQSSQGQEALEDQYSWCGNSTELDQILELDPQNYILRMAKKYYKDNIMLVMDIDPAAITNIMENLDFGEGSVVSFITKDGRELLRDGTIETCIAGSEFYQKAQKSELGSGYIENVTYNGNSYMFLFAKVENADSMVCVLVPNSVIFSRVALIRYLIVLFVVIAAVLSLLIGIVIVNGVNRSIRKLVITFEEMATGNFAVQVQKMSKDELGVLNTHVGSMIQSIRGLIGNVDEIEEKVVGSMEQISGATERLNSSSQEIRDTVNAMGERFTRQVTGTDQCTQLMNDLSSEICLVKDYTDEISQVADHTQQSITESQSKLKDLQHRSTESMTMNMEVVSIINELNQSVSSIETIIEAVNQIAGKTKLLALNASIEAARAGEFGKGFSVVAEEVGELANQSTQATADISQIVAVVKNGILEAVNKSDKAKEVIGLQEEALANTAGGFDSMRQAMSDLMEKFRVIAEKVTSMEREKDVSVDSIAEIAAMVKDNMASMNEMIERINIQADMVMDMDQRSKEVQEQMVQMEHSIDQFKI